MSLKDQIRGIMGGKTIKTEGDVQSFEGCDEPQDLTLVGLSPALRRLVSRHWDAGLYQDAVFAAMREVEVEVRRRMGLPMELTGQALMARALKDSTAAWMVAPHTGEQDGAFFLYSGAMMFIRNPMAHRTISLTQEDALQVLGFADLLLKWLDGGLEHGVSARRNWNSMGSRSLSADLTGDGKRDMVRLEGSYCPSLVLYREGVEISRVRVGGDESGNAGWSIWAGDLNRDGRAEIVAVGLAGAVTEYCQVFAVREEQLVAVSPMVFGWGGVVLADVNGDGLDELVVSTREIPDESGPEQPLWVYGSIEYCWRDGLLVRNGDDEPV